MDIYNLLSFESIRSYVFFLIAITAYNLALKDAAEKGN